jgi:hypothetical protein
MVMRHPYLTIRADLTNTGFSTETMSYTLRRPLKCPLELNLRIFQVFWPNLDIKTITNHPRFLMAMSYEFSRIFDVKKSEIN